MANITFKVPAIANGKIVYVEKSGSVAWLELGDKKEKFVLQFGGIDNAPEFVTHWATGQKMPGSLREIALSKRLAYGHAHPLNYRDIALQLIRQIVSENGLERVLKVIRAAPIVNN